MTVAGRCKSALWEFLQRLVDLEPHVQTADDPPWHEFGKLYEVDEETYWYFLELLPPRWMDGDWFAYGEGAGSFCVYFKRNNRHFARQLSDDETQTFCQLSGTPLHI